MDKCEGFVGLTLTLICSVSKSTINPKDLHVRFYVNESDITISSGYAIEDEANEKNYKVHYQFDTLTPGPLRIKCVASNFIFPDLVATDENIVSVRGDLSLHFCCVCQIVYDKEKKLDKRKRRKEERESE